MNPKARNLLVAGVLLWVVAAAAYGTLRLTYGQRPAYVHVRWAATADVATREQNERAHSLTRRETKQDARTWGYYLTDLSNRNIRDLVSNPAVEDTHYIHRTAFRPWRTATRGAYVSARPAWIAVTLELLIRACLVLGAVALAAGALKTWRSRRARALPAAR